jgi:exopolyphosphatase/pppGpp-phosphohydrolase
LVLGLQEYDSDKVTGTVVTLDEMRSLAERLLKTPVEDISRLPCMPKGRADVLAGGVLWLATLMERFSFSSLTVSDRDNLEGYAIKKGLMV